ncbi:MAG: hypothetical protein EOO07_05810 [Chitinophagaceae bacterium]|nr:MAG: hypothetical protein EOO07_05810 [Chitinophagaceae bacterium]
MDIDKKDFWTKSTIIASANGYSNAISLAKIGQIMALQGEPINGVSFFRNKHDATEAYDCVVR